LSFGYELGVQIVTMIGNHGAWARKATRLVSEPTIHFFIIGAVIFLAHRLIAGDPRTIIVGPAVRTDLARRFRDRFDRSPSTAEIDTALQSWKLEESLYREALCDGLDREDPMVRTLLINKVRERAALQSPVREPTEAELQQWLAEHRNLYEMPLVYEHEYAVFPKNAPAAEQQRERYERALRAGATPAKLGLRTVAANVRRERIEEEFGAELAKRICSLPVGDWHPLENQNNLVLVRMIRIEGGLPGHVALRDRLVMDWKSTMQQKAVDRAAQAIEARYRFREQSK
jgi:hypothetical protein